MSLKSDKKVGVSLFNALYMLDPVPEEDAIFKSSWFKHFKLDRTGTKIHIEGNNDVIQITDTFMTIDAAVEEGRGDYSAIVVSTTDKDGKIYILECFREQVNPVQFIDKMVEMYKQWNCFKCAGQKGVVENMLLSFLKEKMKRDKFYMNIVPIGGITKQSKEYRIKSLQPYYESGSVYHRRGHCEELEEELIRFPKARYDDLSDATQMQLDIIMPSSGQPIKRKEYSNDSLYVWKKRLGKLFNEKGKSHYLGKIKNSNGIVINESFYR
jgi:predicted phage terminase large subunit-like protein